MHCSDHRDIDHFRSTMTIFCSFEVQDMLLFEGRKDTDDPRVFFPLTLAYAHGQRELLKSGCVCVYVSVCLSPAFHGSSEVR
jgi:hypothetical protein